MISAPPPRNCQTAHTSAAVVTRVQHSTATAFGYSFTFGLNVDNPTSCTHTDTSQRLGDRNSRLSTSDPPAALFRLARRGILDDQRICDLGFNGLTWDLAFTSLSFLTPFTSTQLLGTFPYCR
jgi:hypothetical protein